MPPAKVWGAGNQGKLLQWGDAFPHTFHTCLMRTTRWWDNKDPCSSAGVSSSAEDWDWTPDCSVACARADCLFPESLGRQRTTQVSEEQGLPVQGRTSQTFTPLVSPRYLHQPFRNKWRIGETDHGPL